MAELDPRLNFTEEEERYIGSSYNPYGTAQSATIGKNLSQQYVVVEKDDTWESIAEGLQLDTADLLKANPDEMSLNIGTAINAPKFGGLTEEEQFWQEKLNISASYIDFLTHQETLGVTGLSKFGGRTSQPFETEFGTMQFPEGFNFQEFKMFAESTKDTGFWDQYGRFSEGTLDLGKNIFDVGQGRDRPGEYIDPRQHTVQELATLTNKFYPSSMIETGGLPTYAKWRQNPQTGEWEAQDPEAVFDELYRINGIDPNDKVAVEGFWSLADEDMLYAGEFFDVIEWPQGGYGGYGGMPTPSRQASRGARPSRGDYASYLSLTSWSI